MSEREQAKQIIDTLPDYKMQAILMFLRGVEFDDELEDDRFCEKLVDDYLKDDSPDKHESISLEEFAAQEGIALRNTKSRLRRTRKSSLKSCRARMKPES